MLKVYAIGDVHGLLRALCRLIAECERDADGRPMRLVFIGDYIDRGPNSRGVVDYIMNLQSRLAENATEDLTKADAFKSSPQRL
jgi:serine/threonine protein phosphatase 1